MEASRRLVFKDPVEEDHGLYSTCSFVGSRRKNTYPASLTWYHLPPPANADANEEDAERIKALRAALLLGTAPEMSMVSNLDAAAFANKETGRLYVIRDKVFFRIDSTRTTKIPGWMISRSLARYVLRRLENPAFSHYADASDRVGALAPSGMSEIRGSGPWREEIYTNRRHLGRPVLVHGVDTLHYNTKTSSRLPNDILSVRWDTCLVSEAGQNLRFRLHASHDASLYLDDSRLARTSREQPVDDVVAHVEAGLHHVRVEPSLPQNHWRIDLQAGPADGPIAPIPAEQLRFPGLRVEGAWCGRATAGIAPDGPRAAVRAAGIEREPALQ
jgi:hypothetical protein